MFHRNEKEEMLTVSSVSASYVVYGGIERQTRRQSSRKPVSVIKEQTVF